MKMRNQVRTLVLLGVLSCVVVFAGSLFGSGGLLIALALAAAMNVGAWWFSDAIVLRSSGAREIAVGEAPELYALVGELAARAGLPMPKVCIVPAEEPNAFATGRTPDRGVVAVSHGLLRLLSPRELRGVIAHELAHIKNRDTLVATVAAMLATAVASLANLWQLGTLFGGGSQSEEEGQEGGGVAGGLLAALVAPLAATLVQLGISRQREYLADAAGAEIAGETEGLAGALVKLDAWSRGAAERRLEERGEGDALPAPAFASLGIINPFAGGGLGRWFSTHPPIEERVARLQALAVGAERATWGRAA